MKRQILPLFGWTALMLAGALSAHPAAAAAGARGPDSLGADYSPQQDEARAAVRQGRYVTLSRVLEDIRRRTPGVQLDAGLEQWNGRAVYRVRWAGSNGRRIDYIVDAVSGAIISSN